MLKRLFSAILIGILTVSGVFGISFYTILTTKDLILTDFNNVHGDYILVLGASVYNGKPRPMLEDRLKTAIELYKDGVAEKVIMSGDSGKEWYDEVSVMQEYAIENGVAEEDILLDTEGYSTYESVVRAKEVFGAEKVIIVSQKFHFYRALMIAKNIGMEAYGVAADMRTYPDLWYMEIREVLARNKDFVKSNYKARTNAVLRMGADNAAV